MKCCWRIFSSLLTFFFICMLICACNDDTVWRYDPGAPDRPVGLAATADNGQVSLRWSPAVNAAAYAVYYATSPGVTPSTGTKIATVVGTSYIKTGLTNDTTYYFVVTSVNSNSESAASDQIAATPALSAPMSRGIWKGRGTSIFLYRERAPAGCAAH